VDARQRQADLVKQLILGFDRRYNRTPAGLIPEHELVLFEAALDQVGCGTVLLGEYNMQEASMQAGPATSDRRCQMPDCLTPLTA
jgi:hypothetical protein